MDHSNAQRNLAFVDDMEVESPVESLKRLYNEKSNKGKKKRTTNELSLSPYSTNPKVEGFKFWMGF